MTMAIAMPPPIQRRWRLRPLFRVSPSLLESWKTKSCSWSRTELDPSLNFKH
jgi:hypothetical protein